MKLLGPGSRDFEFLNIFATLYRNTLGSTLGWWRGLLGRRVYRNWGQKVFGNPLVLWNIPSQTQRTAKTVTHTPNTKGTLCPYNLTISVSVHGIHRHGSCCGTDPVRWMVVSSSKGSSRGFKKPVRGDCRRRFGRLFTTARCCARFDDEATGLAGLVGCGGECTRASDRRSTGAELCCTSVFRWL